MKLTWASVENYTLQFEVEPGRNDFVLNPIVVLQPTETTGTDKHYEHTQAVPSTTWTINHNLGKYPAITTVDTDNREWYGNITHNSINQAVVNFSSSFGGKAFCN